MNQRDTAHAIFSKLCYDSHPSIKSVLQVETSTSSQKAKFGYDMHFAEDDKCKCGIFHYFQSLLCIPCHAIAAVMSSIACWQVMLLKNDENDMTR